MGEVPLVAAAIMVILVFGIGVIAGAMYFGRWKL